MWKWTLNDESDQLYNLPNYQSVGANRANRKGGGVQIQLHNSISFKARNDLGIFDDNMESIFVEITSVPSSNFKPVIGVVYRPPNTNLELFIEHMSLILNKVKSENKPCYLLGDFNVNLINAESHHGTKEFLDLMYSNSFYPLIHQATRLTSYSSTLIDNVFCNILSSKHLSGILYTDISDHLPIFTINKSSTIALPQAPSITTRNFSESNCAKFQSFMQSVTWDEVLQSTDAQQSYTLFIAKVLENYNLAFPITTFQPKTTRNKPWVTKALKQLIKRKNSLYKLFHNKPTLYNEIQYKRCKGELLKSMKAAEKAHYHQLLHNSKNNLKQTWKVMKDLIGMPSKASASNSFSINGNIVTNKQEIADCFNEYFTNIGSELASKIPPSDTDPSSYLSGNYRESLFLSPVTETEVSDCISQLKSGSAGHDQIKPSIIKDYKQHILDPLTHIINLSFEQGIVPDQIKMANVTPVYKGGDADQIGNFRPISVLSVFAKVYEKLVFQRTYKYLENSSILSNYQFGFRQGYSTEMALLNAIDNLSQALDAKHHVIGVFLDLKKAFDTVNPKILLRKLYHYGIRGVAHEWFLSYLTNRTQCVKFDNCLSSELPVSCGVPQGSTLGPLLFLLYINDLSNALNAVKPIIFADDTNLFLSGSDLDTVVGTFNAELQNLSNWFKTNELSLNVQKKTHDMLFSLSQHIRTRPIPIVIDDSPISQVDKIKFLGVIIDDRLTWSEHISYISGKLSKSIGILKKVAKFLDNNCMLSLYYTLLYPYITYCHLIWGKTSSTHLYRPTLLQKKAISIVCKEKYRAHTDPLFIKCKILKIADLYLYLSTIFIYKYTSNLLPQTFIANFNLVSFPTHSYHTRTTANSNFTIPKCRTTLRQTTLMYQCPKIFNDFINPLNLFQCSSLFVLKKSLKSILA